MDTRRQGDTRDVCAGYGDDTRAPVGAVWVTVYAVCGWSRGVHQHARAVRRCAVLRVLLMTRDRYLRGLRRTARRRVWVARHPDRVDYAVTAFDTMLIVGLVWLMMR